MSRCLGVDGAGSGWLAVWRQGSELGWKRYEDAESLWLSNIDASVIAVDIPIGLEDGSARATDRLARAFVGGKRASSVFAAPMRPALNAANRLEAQTIQRQLGGMGVAAQAFAIYPKIRQWDHLLRGDANARACVHEIHPEVSFAAMRGGFGQGIVAPKRTLEGQEIRLALLAKYFGPKRVERLRAAIPKRIAAIDDVHDALAALWSAERIASGTAQSLPDPPRVDSLGLRMAIWY
ncbi:DUF429 domain-containing protein [Ahniella affigens]|uniref:DUF429 domain-containing protein n=1 Tax=Ahniella affigens TaxID=2021234 RepID=A0A2P1PXD5_9GAMM|nr:DUF429 domain-containing protein [Ahniella affigens]AVP99497.1 DUF429 domain-containing protein [Ahniella affigens]